MFFIYFSLLLCSLGKMNFRWLHLTDILKQKIAQFTDQKVDEEFNVDVMEFHLLPNRIPALFEVNAPFQKEVNEFVKFLESFAKENGLKFMKSIQEFSKFLNKMGTKYLPDEMKSHLMQMIEAHYHDILDIHHLPIKEEEIVMNFRNLASLTMKGELRLIENLIHRYLHQKKKKSFVHFVPFLTGLVKLELKMKTYFPEAQQKEILEIIHDFQNSYPLSLEEMEQKYLPREEVGTATTELTKGKKTGNDEKSQKKETETETEGKNPFQEFLNLHFKAEETKKLQEKKAQQEQKESELDEISSRDFLEFFSDLSILGFDWKKDLSQDFKKFLIILITKSRKGIDWKGIRVLFNALSKFKIPDLKEEMRELGFNAFQIKEFFGHLHYYIVQSFKMISPHDTQKAKEISQVLHGIASIGFRKIDFTDLALNLFLQEFDVSWYEMTKEERMNSLYGLAKMGFTYDQLTLSLQDKIETFLRWDIENMQSELPSHPVQDEHFQSLIKYLETFHLLQFNWFSWNQQGIKFAMMQSLWKMLHWSLPRMMENPDLNIDALLDYNEVLSNFFYYAGTKLKQDWATVIPKAIQKEVFLGLEQLIPFSSWNQLSQMVSG
jgi:hypothetical protein